MSESSEAESESRDFTYTLAQVAHVLAPAVLRPGEDIQGGHRQGSKAGHVCDREG